MARKWKWKSEGGEETDVSQDDATREFGDKLITVFRDVVQAVVNSKGWFLFPAGRRPRHQLIGDAIGKFGGELNDCVMVQYNSLQNPALGAALPGGHDAFVQSLRDNSVGLQEFSTETPPIPSSVIYASEHATYPSTADIQGPCYIDGKGVDVATYIQSRCSNISETAISIHPNSTHLIFWDVKGNRRGGGQNLPWTEIDNFHDYLSSTLGIAEGCLLVNGDQADLNNSTSFVSKGIPVIAVKSVGGASEFLAQQFEMRQDNGRGRDVGFSPRYPKEAVAPQYHSVYFEPPDDAEDKELVVVDAVNPGVRWPPVPWCQWRSVGSALLWNQLG